MSSWEFFLQDTGGGETYLHWLMRAWGVTLSLAFFSMIVALAVGSVVGILRTTPSRMLVFLGDAWTEFFRDIPLLVQLFVWYHVIPSIFLSLRAVPSFVLVIFALGFFTSARIAEQVRAGIQSLPRGQRYAGLAMGLTLAQTYRYVLLPTAYRIIIPPLTSEAMNIVKNTSVAFAVSIGELIAFTLQAQEETSKGTQIYLAVSILYFISAFAVNRAFHFLEGKVQVPGMIGGKA